MTIHKELEKQGNWLYRWRSYLPLLILPFLFIALSETDFFERVLGISDLFWEILCLLLSFVGLTIRCLTIGYTPEGTSGRNTKKQIAEVLNTTGMYSVVRHPLYLGNFIIFLGIILFIQVWWFALIAALAFFIYYERIMFAEEAFLLAKYGVLFPEWAGKTPAFLPKFKNWQNPVLPFSFKNVFKREHTTFLMITTSFPALDALEDLFPDGKLQLEIGWGLLFIIGLITYLLLRTLKKKSNLLDVKGR